MSSVSLNERLNRLAVPLWIESLSPSLAYQPKLLQHLILRPDLQPLVVSFSWSFTDALTIPYDFTALRLLTHLRSLDIELTGEAENLFLPRAFTEALKAFRNLEALTLEIEMDVVFEDSEFSIGQDLPHLRNLTLWSHNPESSPLPRLMRHTCPNLETFRILDACEEDNAYKLIPWTTVKSVNINVEYRATWPLQPVIHGLRAAFSSFAVITCASTSTDIR